MQLTTVSALLRRPELGLGNGVDLLKVDVERAELAVLRGVDAADWPRIRQVSMEVHDVDGQLERVLDLLRTQGRFEKAREAAPCLRALHSVSVACADDASCANTTDHRSTAAHTRG